MVVVFDDTLKRDLLIASYPFNCEKGVVKRPWFFTHLPNQVLLPIQCFAWQKIQGSWTFCNGWWYPLCSVTPTTLRKSSLKVSGSWIFWHTSVRQPRFGLTEDSRTTYLHLGFFVLILISMASSRQLWTYLTDWFNCSQKWPSELRSLTNCLTFP